jgi:hypothetical protein
MDKFLVVLIAALMAFAFAFGMACLFALPVMWLWNYAAVDLGARSLDFSHALALSLLCSLLFKSSSTTQSKK